MPPPKPLTPKPFKPLNALGSFLTWAGGLFRPTYFKQTPFRLTLVFITVYSFVAVLIFAYVYVATSAENRAVTDAQVSARLDSLQQLYRERGEAEVKARLRQDDITEWFFIKGIYNSNGEMVAQNKRASLEMSTEVLSRIRAQVDTPQIEGRMLGEAPGRSDFVINFRSYNNDGSMRKYRYRGQGLRIDPDRYLFVAMDMSWTDEGFDKGFTALWGGAILVVFMGLFAGMIINQEVSRSVQGLMSVLRSAEQGDLKVRVPLRHSGDEFDALAAQVNQVLDRVEKNVGSLKYAGDAIAHDLRTPLSRLRSNLELSLYDVEKDPSKAEDALSRALTETDQLLRTFQTVFAISRLQAAGQAPDPKLFDATALATDMAELYELSAADKGLEFDVEIEPNVWVMGNRDFLAQSLANLLDNAIKYTAVGGITFRLRKTSRGEIEFSITDTGMGVPSADRGRIVQRFVRLEQSRSLPGVGLGLSMVAAVAEAHKGRLVIDEGPGKFNDQGPGLRTALVLPPTQG
ncbi:HAMP domain-containing sensor histidine kinase [Asticcacaulis sp. ZE23SCel15]|uniref:sensor histidine kinase n=1 Tax=Asticcacaulis sp. ZE23SCel15 TaxID=3059027 RepID=UPI00265F1749|nr:HAMP domain-containing sensor histidine kinase [Asticcacaulis sp. ZE23SCel15]WKL57699.1 HAMP domain-containing sensor histidine kinase [Asticcacaulis sp. ZE23SCel15]